MALLPPPATPRRTGPCRWRPPPEALARLGEALWHGRHNRLSESHRPWPIVDLVAEASRKDGPPAPAYWWSAPACGVLPEPDRDRGLCARSIIRQRRSALALDGRTPLPRKDFDRMLIRLLPDGPEHPLAVLPWKPAVHLLLFVHRVEGLGSGLYLLVRRRDEAEGLRRSMRRRFRWQIAPACPQGLDLFLLDEGDFREPAQVASCGQEIAADGAFAAAMLAEFEPRLLEHGPWFYRRQHWEAGALGQILYLEAEAAGLRATGIGCFFDDVTHEVAGLADRRYQTVYHFTLGGPIDDRRLTTLPAYRPS